MPVEDDLTRGKLSLFRRAAIEQYINNSQEKVLPQFMRPRTFLLLWLLLGLFFGLSLGATFLQVPYYADSLAIAGLATTPAISAGPGSGSANPPNSTTAGAKAPDSTTAGAKAPDSTELNQVSLTLLLPSADLKYLHPGQIVIFHDPIDNSRGQAHLTSIYPTLLSAEATSRQFNLPVGALLNAKTPSAIAFARVDTATGRAAALYPGGSYTAEVDLGLRPVWALLPITGTFWTE